MLSIGYHSDNEQLDVGATHPETQGKNLKNNPLWLQALQVMSSRNPHVLS